MYIDLHDEITLPSGEKKILREELGGWVEGYGKERKETARIAAKFWDEYSKKQTLLSTFFAKGSTKTTSDPSPDTLATAIPHQTSDQVLASTPKSADDHDGECVSLVADETDDTQPTMHDETMTSPIPPNPSSLGRDDASKVSLKRKMSGSDGSTAEQKASRKVGPKLSEQEMKVSKAVKKARSGQTTLASFLSQPTPSTSSKPHYSTKEKKKSSSVPAKAKSMSNNPLTVSDESETDSQRTTMQSKSLTTNLVMQLEEDYAYALSLAETGDPPSASQKSSSTSSRDAWSKLTAPIVPPRCAVHGEPAKQFTVNKSGPNKGKLFYICSRSVPVFDCDASRNDESCCGDNISFILSLINCVALLRPDLLAPDMMQGAACDYEKKLTHAIDVIFSSGQQMRGASKRLQREEIALAMSFNPPSRLRRRLISHVAHQLSFYFRIGRTRATSSKFIEIAKLFRRLLSCSLHIPSVVLSFVAYFPQFSLARALSNRDQIR